MMIKITTQDMRIITALLEADNKELERSAEVLMGRLTVQGRKALLAIKEEKRIGGDAE